MGEAIPVYCAWHPRYFGHDLHMGGPIPVDGELVSHGICRACNEIFREENALPKKEEVTRCAITRSRSAPRGGST